MVTHCSVLGISRNNKFVGKFYHFVLLCFNVVRIVIQKLFLLSLLLSHKSYREIIINTEYDKEDIISRLMSSKNWQNFLKVA